LSFFLCGVGFGLFRVNARKQLIDTQPAQRVGQIVSTCNAYGFPVLMIGAWLYAITWSHGPVVPLAAFTVFALVGARTMRGGTMAKMRGGSPLTPSRITPVAPTD
jgi:hypothetical protein